MTDHAKELRRHADKIGRPAGDVPAVMHAAAAHIEKIERRLHGLEWDVTHWRANHAAEVLRARVLKERIDMPLDRVDAYKQIGELLARIAELEAERAEREKQEPALYVQSNHFAQAKFSPFLARVCQQPIEGIATMPLYAASTVTAQSEGQIDKATSLLRRAADYLGYAGAPRLASEISSYLESQAQPPKGKG